MTGLRYYFLSVPIDLMVEYFVSELFKVYDSHAPVQPVRVRNALAPWHSPEIRRIMAKRDQTKCRLNREPFLSNLNAYKKLRSFSNRMCSDAKLLKISPRLWSGHLCNRLV